MVRQGSNSTKELRARPCRHTFTASLTLREYLCFAVSPWMLRYCSAIAIRGTVSPSKTFTPHKYHHDMILMSQPLPLLQLHLLSILRHSLCHNCHQAHVLCRRPSLPPLLLRYSEMAASKMTQSQCCIVSGESGAGKTESAKLIMEQVSPID